MPFVSIIMHFLLSLIAFLPVSIAASLPNSPGLFDFLISPFVNSIPSGELNPPTLSGVDIISQGKDLTEFNRIDPGSIFTAPAFSTANDLTPYDPISTDSTPILSDDSGISDLLASTETEETSSSNSDEEPFITADLSANVPEQICALHNTATRQECRDLRSILIEESQMELQQLQRPAGSQGNREFEKLLRDDTNWLHNRRIENPSTYLQDNAGARYQCKGNEGRLVPMCCLGPPGSSSTPATEIQARQLLHRQNGENDKQNCVTYLLRRRWCEPAKRRFCCMNRGEPMNPGWGFWGVDCVPMNAAPL